ncbi:hypothetical protein D3C76_1368160 [compost metagenome]
MPQGAAETVRLFASQFRVSHTGHVDQTAHPQKGVEEETVKVDHPLIGVAFQEGVDHAGRFFQVRRKVAYPITRRHGQVVAPGHGHRAKYIRIQDVIVEVEHRPVKSFQRIGSPLWFILWRAGTAHQ